jgi:hypothetical protein
MECWEKHQSTPYGKKLIDKWSGTRQELIEFKQKNTHLGGYQHNLYLDNPTCEYVHMKKYFKNVKNFSDYVHNFYELDLVESFFLRQTAFTSSAWNYDNKKMDFVGKSEELQQSCDFICESINVKRKKLPKINKSEHKHWSSYFTNDTKRLIGILFDIDFKYWGYEK